MKQKTKVALSAFALGTNYSTLVSAIMHSRHWTVTCSILLLTLIFTIIFIKAYSDE